MRLAALAVTSALAAAVAGPLPPLPLGKLLGAPDRLTVQVSGTGNPLADGEYQLECDPPAGTHPKKERACARLDQLAQEGKDPFAPVPEGRMCSFQDGGPATAHVTGTWRGRQVDARFQRRNGCEIKRWNDLEPLLPGRAS
ncbi:SSI family serine proteinase inhibitor [Streptomyces antimicrobicus]|uniref:Subtilase-type protease inhibitor n=1 Tax=Streptomyces antimicrobicus TaxID=2883108 RepID=A0ABS8B954_9ACTN|nr:SSI family serine proteinase inhibitor [Streptomyces antimicrobicus]MCB5181144.1 subtilase-type protease inhibitor [Streptomyces antimicrobicus]